MPVTRSRSYKRRLPAGIVDAGFASLATFAAGLSAVNLLDISDLGVYAVFFTAFLLGTVLPRNLIFTPTEVLAVAFPVDTRLTFVPRSLALGLGPAVVGAGAALIAVAVTTPYATGDVLIALALTSAVTTILSPLQDHVRAMLHLATRSWLAATVSIVQFVSVVVAIGVMLALDIPAAWIPFGALAIANTISLAVSRLIVHLADRSAAPERLRFRALASKGKWLVIQASASVVAGFSVAAIIPWLAGPEALGHAESARVVAQPILVLAAGLTAVLGPRSMRAGMERDGQMARRMSRVYFWIIGLAGIGYIAVFGWDWALNPMSFAVPSAYVVPGLVALTVVANMVTAGVFLQVNELLGAQKETTLARIAWSVSPILLLGGLTAGVTGAYARAIGIIGQTGGRYLMQDYTLRGVYGTESQTNRSVTPGTASDDTNRE